ncbi:MULTISPECIES: histidinol-phosphate transaminase [Leuconostoc gelidum group]|uniref:histidinol-phosphate transaminase n=1 Tax=Leuconostoc gelidum group TaxID=3016637 RepID=UPI00021937E4|nr:MULTISPECIES: histidinol-phosphate transaminase [Leuconostoc gelidum group]AFS40048.1 histidinol-phosphate aminotransferase [Leuconostoc gelidum JB7]MBZ5969560.1 histidinol-phosphate transaminase [Leuconostoc gasicomitatum]MBZ5987793.1 histidinol-phosphate transaminase [Leuconostoc gasicomitatum]MBZ5989379.1 histidinol-phosphate transaminase [Leuconostoc gasicomitatum]MBZ5992408.1 histidinol-phosphate transaminase [Leuconostoc gelidum subsp. gelidum]
MKESIKNMKAYQAELPAEAVKAKYGLSHLARLSANESVYGPSPKVYQAIRATADDILGYYPDGQATVLREAVAKHDHVAPESLVFGVGADELIQLLTRTVLTPGSNIIIPDPTFGEYAMHAQIEQADTKKIPVKLETGQVDFDAMLAAVNEKTSMVWLANPNNPTGVFEKRSDILAFLEKLPKTVILVVDEAYYDFVDEPDATVAIDVKNYTNLVVLRTLSKAYGLANLRVGYGIMQEPLYGVMQAVRLPYNLNTYQIVGATAAVEDQNYLNQVVTKTQVERKQFQTFLRDNNLTFYDSQTNFIWIKVGDTKKVGEYLLSQGYQVNDHLNSEWIRIALGTAEDNVGMRKAILTIMK